MKPHIARYFINSSIGYVWGIWWTRAAERAGKPANFNACSLSEIRRAQFLWSHYNG